MQAIANDAEAAEGAITPFTWARIVRDAEEYKARRPSFELGAFLDFVRRCSPRFCGWMAWNGAKEAVKAYTAAKKRGDKSTMPCLAFAITADRLVIDRDNCQAADHQPIKWESRRIGLDGLRAGQRLLAIDNGHPLERPSDLKPIGVIEVVTVRLERLDEVTQAGVVAEGFPGMTPEEFVTTFRDNHTCQPDQVVTVIGFKHVVSVGTIIANVNPDYNVRDVPGVSTRGLNVDVWQRIVKAAERHKARHRSFQIDDYLRFVRRQDARYLAWAAFSGTVRVNKSRHARENAERIGGFPNRIELDEPPARRRGRDALPAATQPGTGGADERAAMDAA